MGKERGSDRRETKEGVTDSVSKRKKEVPMTERKTKSVGFARRGKEMNERNMEEKGKSVNRKISEHMEGNKKEEE